ncbi:MAG: mechanosensitive ion channel [Methylococcales bacterium]|nr:mechanosensitive ion channel [Methylococcales bacterium]
MNQLLLKFFILFLVSTCSFATTTTQIETLTSEFIQSKTDALNARQGLEEATKNAVLKQYQAAQDNLTSKTQAITQIAAFTAALHQAPIQTKKLEKEIEQTLAKQSKQKAENFSQIPVEELEQRLIIEKGKVSQLDEQLKKVEADLTLQNNRPILIREETVETQQTIEATRKKLELPAAPTDSKLEYEARQIYYKTLIETLTTELKRLDAEAISQPARVELLKTQLQLFDIQKNSLTPIVTTIENLAFDLRSQEAKKMEDALSQTEKELEGKHPLIQQHTHENIQYSRDLQAVTTKIEQLSEQKTFVELKTTSIENDFKSADKKISLAELSPALGKILREQRRSLASQNEVTTESKKLQNETALTSLEQFKVEAKQKELLNLDDALKQMMVSQVEPLLPFEERMMIQAQLRVLLNNQKELLNKLAQADSTYLRTLGDLDFARQQMLTQAEKFATYLDERLLWVPSSEPVNFSIFSGLYHSLQWLFSPSNWSELLHEIISIFTQNSLRVIMAIGFWLLLIRARNWSQQNLQLNETELRNWHTDHFYFTLRVLLNRILVTLVMPSALFLLGSFLSRSVFDFTMSFGIGLTKAAISAFMLQFCYAMFSKEGIARRHFQWQKSTVILLHDQLSWLRFVIVPAMFFIHLTSTSKFSEYSDSLGRLALITLLCSMTIFFTRVLHPTRGLNLPEKFSAFWRYIIYALIIAVPLVIMGFAVTSYYLSALELQEKLIATLRLFIAAILLHEILLRWLTLTNRKLAVKTALETDEKNAAFEDETLDLPKINAQTRKLLHVALTISVILGCWLIWKNILPAFSFLDKVVLWQHKVVVENQESLEPITLANLFLSGIYLFLAIITVRNFSGLLELFIFQRWDVDAGSRYAFNQLTKYFLITFTFIVISNELGGSWSQVQFLVAALGVGLGFGLQEIFANLVSGIILLFERPIRVGDIVTIGDVTGRVCRIQMRATTLIDWDQYEVIVPNKTFITSRLTNWTLSDSTTRVVILLGIAYDSDVKFAHDLILQTVKETPLILRDPEPNVFFMEFGDSALKFSIRFFVSETAHRLPVTHDLNIRLEQVLRENKISIPFPQRDIHIVAS